MWPRGSFSDHRSQLAVELSNVGLKTHVVSQAAAQGEAGAGAAGWG